jgi:hypothetical protein
MWFLKEASVVLKTVLNSFMTPQKAQGEQVLARALMLVLAGKEKGEIGFHRYTITSKIPESQLREKVETVASVLKQREYID